MALVLHAIVTVPRRGINARNEGGVFTEMLIEARPLFTIVCIVVLRPLTSPQSLNTTMIPTYS